MSSPVLVVTGAGSGIGLAVARQWLARGRRLVAIDHDATALERLADADRAVTAGTERLLTHRVDVADEAATRSAIAESRAAFGRIDGAFANAGVELNGPAHELSIADWNTVIGTNLTGVFVTCQVTLAVMIRDRQPGSIVCTSSPSAFVGFAGGENAAYGASKGGISALVRSLAVDYARHGIRVNAVVPGATDTPMLAGADADAGTAERLARLAAEQIPLGRTARPDEIARAVLWLLSDDASYVTGSHLVVDGGLTARGANTF